MISEEEIRELKKTHKDLAKRVETIGTSHRPATVKLSKQLKLLIAEIEDVQEKGKTVWNPAVSTRIKMAKRAMELSKDSVYFERWAASEFQKGNLPEATGKRLASIARLAREGKIPAAKEEFAYFNGIIKLSDSYEKAEEDLKESGRALRREQLRVEKLLADISELENETIDQEKVRRHGELEKGLDSLRRSRDAYLHSLLSKPVAELLRELEGLKEHCPSFPENEAMAQLKQFFSDYPSFGRYDVGQLCECLTYSEKKLSHICPETSRFRKIVASNAAFFEAVRSFAQAGFLAVDGLDERTLDFYSAMGESERKTVEDLRSLGKERRAYEEEYEKSRRLAKRREELAKYSKKELEAELKDVARLIEFLDSGNPDRKAESAEKSGLLSMFGSLFRKA